MKKLAIIGIALIVVGAAGLFLTGGFSVANHDKALEEEKRTIESEGVDAVEISLDIGKVTVTEGNTNDIAVHYKGNLPTDRFKFEAERKNNQAHIAAQSRSLFFSIPFITAHWDAKRELLVELPKKSLSKVVVNSDTSQVFIESLSAAELEVKNDTGQIFIEKFRGEKLKLRSDTGDISVNDAAGEIDVLTDVGSIALALNEITHDIRLESDVGSINVAMKHVPDSLSLDVYSEVGPVSVIGLTGFDDLTGTPIRAIKGDGGPLLDVKTDVGSIMIAQSD